MYYAYHRVSTREQHLDRGVNEIREFCRTQGIALSGIYLDKQTGKDFNRPEYHKLKQVLRQGDVLIVTELDRFGRDKKAILEELRAVERIGARLMVLEIPTTLMDFSGFKDDLAQMMVETISNMLLEMYASLAQAEMQKREKRQREGIDPCSLRELGRTEMGVLRACVNKKLQIGQDKEEEETINRKDAITILEERAEEKGKMEGKAEGKAEGRAEGRAEGEAETALQNIKGLMETMGLIAEQAMEAMKISDNDREAIRPLL